MKNYRNVYKNIGWVGVLSFFFLTGMMGCKKNAGAPTAPSGISPDSGAGGATLYLVGDNLAGAKNIMFSTDSVPAPFDPEFNTNSALIFTVPDTAFGGSQNIIVTFNNGTTLSVPFNVIALPSVSSASIYEFVAGSSITLTGNNLNNVSSVVIHGTAAACTIVSQTRQTMTITMPATTASLVQLDLTNTSGTTTTSNKQEYANINGANNFVWFADGAYGANVQDWSWDASALNATGPAVLGTGSLQETYSAGSWSALSFETTPAVTASNYAYCSLWVFGGAVSEQIDCADETSGTITTITVPPGVWTNFQLPTSGWLGNDVISRLDFKMHGPTTTDVVYFDDVMFVQ